MTKPITFCPLLSSSSGNATFISCGQTQILVDCGASGQTIENALSQIGYEPKNLGAILLTHSHNDHIYGAGILSRQYNIPIHVSIGTWDKINKSKTAKKFFDGVLSRNIKVFHSSTSFELDDFFVEPFSTPHDAPDSVGYRLTHDGVAVAVATDLGHISPLVAEKMTGASVVLLESNYDIDMLETGPYTEWNKRRIRGNYGHLSNDHAGAFAHHLLQSGTQRIYLGHLSDNNNTPEIAMQTVLELIRQNGITSIPPNTILLAEREKPGHKTTVDRNGCS